jgi:Xaa-Pro aminopeptidase
VLTVGDVKAHIAVWCMEQGLEDSEGVIFAIGRDAGVPHSTGKAEDPIRLGQPIVFDFFPQEAGGGYFYDITRTWCLGHAPKDVERLYEQVLGAYQISLDSFTPGMLCRYAQRRVCEYFEAQGHPTLLSNTTTETGYVHTLGHGVGLNIHESPVFSDIEQNNSRLDPGMVFTLEPGLYYPERGMGVRLEDTLVIHGDARVEVLAEYPMDLVLPMRHAPRTSAPRAKAAARRPAKKAAPTKRRPAPRAKARRR